VQDEAVQSAFRLALPCVPLDHPDHAALQLVTNVLGGYTLARLFTILREEKGYTYGAYAFNDVRPAGALTGILTSVGNDFTADTMRVIAQEVTRIGTERIDDEEFENARQQLLGTFARSNETPQQTASLVWTMIQHDLPDAYFAEHMEKLQALTPDDVRAVQHSCFRTDVWVVGIAGQEAVIRDAVGPYVATIEPWDTKGYA
jgi:predicted Zn-dependent peptidase